MTYRSESRGLMYTAPPSGDEKTRDEETADSEVADAPETTDETIDPTPTADDANWTGTVSADD